MKRIFISYARTDQAFASKLARALENAGADVWIDLDDIPIGEKWSSAIQNGLDSADAMLVILSPFSMESSNVEDEWQYFMDHGSPIIPVLWQPTKVHFQLNRLQYVDFHTNDFEIAFPQLLHKLQEKGIALTTTQPTPLAINIGEEKPEQSPEHLQPEKELSKRTKYIQWGIGAILALMLVIQVVWFAYTDWANTATTDDQIAEGIQPGFAFEEQPLIVAGEAWQVHEEPNDESRLLDVNEGIVISRFLADGLVWHTVQDMDTGVFGYQLDDFIPLYDEPILFNVLPVQTAITETELELFDKPYYSDESIDVSAEPFAFVHGYLLDPTAGLHWYMTVFQDANDISYTGWWHDEDRDLSPNLPVAGLAYIEDFTNAYWYYDDDEIATVIRPNDLVWIFHAVNGFYSVGYYKTDDREWANLYIPVASVDVSEPMRTTIVEEAIAD